MSKSTWVTIWGVIDVTKTRSSGTRVWLTRRCFDTHSEALAWQRKHGSANTAIGYEFVKQEPPHDI